MARRKDLKLPDDAFCHPYDVAERRHDLMQIIPPNAYSVPWFPVPKSPVTQSPSDEDPYARGVTEWFCGCKSKCFTEHCPQHGDPVRHYPKL
jgi:hypothetical protein